MNAQTLESPTVLPDPPLEPTRPGEPPRIDPPELPDPAEPWNDPQPPEPPTPLPPALQTELPPDDDLKRGSRLRDRLIAGISFPLRHDGSSRG